ncbi:MAG TPA: PGPGW domain-containing protein [Microterricola sp.]
MSEQSNAKRVGAAFGRATSTAAHRARHVIRRNQTVNTVYRTGVGVVGGGTVALGIVLMPLPGPGALIALGGLGILATEFEGARKVSRTANTAVGKGVAAAKAAKARRDAARAAAPQPAPE